MTVKYLPYLHSPYYIRFHMMLQRNIVLNENILYSYVLVVVHHHHHHHHHLHLITRAHQQMRYPNVT